MEIMPSAMRHGVTTTSIHHAIEHAIRLVEFEYGGEDRLLIIGPDETAQLLEIVAVPGAQPNRVIHADILRPKFLDYLR